MGGGMVVGLAFGVACGRAPEVAGDRPHVVILMLDTVRADHMSVYGYGRPTTPRLAAFAEGAVTFDRAQSAGLWTVPAHASLFTGMPLSSHGADAAWIWLDDRFLTVGEWFGQHGYDTWAFSANPYVSESSHLLQGFETVRLSFRGPDRDAAALETTAKLDPSDASTELSPAWAGEGPGWPRHITHAKDGGRTAATALLKHLDGVGDQPVFAFINYLEAHHPRVPSRAAREAVLTPEAVAATYVHDLSLRHLMGGMEGRLPWTDAERAALVDAYDASLVDLDAAVGELLDGLKARNLLEQTVVVVVADHGEHLGEEDMFDHRWSVRQPLMHVPLIVSAPGLKPGRRGDVVSTMGVFAALTELAGLPKPPTPHWPSVLGSRTGAVVAESGAPVPRLPWVEALWPDLAPRRWNRRWQVAWQETYKFARSDDGVVRLHDLATDPAEVEDLAADRPGLADAAVRAMVAATRPFPPYDRQQRSPMDRPRPALTFDEPMAGQLEALGYAEPSP